VLFLEVVGDSQIWYSESRTSSSYTTDSYIHSC